METQDKKKQRIKELNESLKKLHRDFTNKRRKLEKKRDDLQNELLQEGLKELKDKFLNKTLILKENASISYLKVKNVRSVDYIENANFAMCGKSITLYETSGIVEINPQRTYEHYIDYPSEVSELIIASDDDLYQLKKLIDASYEKIFM